VYEDAFRHTPGTTGLALEERGRGPYAHEPSFFFSSRRRHTRLVSDWSSDVCSSDLWTGLRQKGDRGPPSNRDARPRLAGGNRDRSEERRVGKECRSRWWRYQ